MEKQRSLIAGTSPPSSNKISSAAVCNNKQYLAGAEAASSQKALRYFLSLRDTVPDRSRRSAQRRHGVEALTDVLWRGGRGSCSRALVQHGRVLAPSYSRQRARRGETAIRSDLRHVCSSLLAQSNSLCPLPESSAERSVGGTSYGPRSELRWAVSTHTPREPVCLPMSPPVIRLPLGCGTQLPHSTILSLLGFQIATNVKTSADCFLASIALRQFPS
jgi:hypothetical protein